MRTIFFHQIGGAVHVMAPAGRRHMQDAVVLDHKAQAFQDGMIFVARHLDAAQLLDQCRIEQDRLVRRRQLARDHHIGGLAAAPFQDQPGAKFQPGSTNCGSTPRSKR